MGVLRAIGLAFLGFIALLMIITIVAILMSRLGTPGTTQPPNPVEINYAAAGIEYKGPPTTALAGYYCIYQAQVANDGWVTNCTVPTNQWWAKTCNYQPSQNAYTPPGYSIQLNAQLTNGLWLQDAYGAAWQGNTPLLEEETWGDNIRVVLSKVIGPPGGSCGWLVIKIQNGNAYFGYSNDGVHVDWYASYPVGNATIISYYDSGIALAGPGNGAGVDFSNVYTVLALYYWNGTGWAPAPVEPGDITGEFVTHAWVYVSNNEAVVSWPNQATSTVSVPQPGFSP